MPPRQMTTISFFLFERRRRRRWPGRPGAAATGRSRPRSRAGPAWRRRDVRGAFIGVGTPGTSAGGRSPPGAIRRARWPWRCRGVRRSPSASAASALGSRSRTALAEKAWANCMRLTMASGAAQDWASSGQPLGEGAQNGFWPSAVRIGAELLEALRLAAGGAVAGDDELVGRLELARPRVPGLRRVDQGLGDLGQVAAGSTVQAASSRATRAGGGSSATKWRAILRADELRGLRLGGQVGQDRVGLALAALVVAHAHDRARARLVGLLAEDRDAVGRRRARRRCDRPVMARANSVTSAWV